MPAGSGTVEGAAVGGSSGCHEAGPGEVERQTRNIILLSDGTGNSAAKLFKTNVWRIGDALDLSGGGQLFIYDDGVGTESFRPLALLGGAFGWGLARNVRSLYKFLCRNYRCGDRIYCFGFSRGAFTIRVLVGLLHAQGIVSSKREGELDVAARENMAAYHRGYRTNPRLLVDRIFGLPPRTRPAHPAAPPIAFVGLWDTVGAHGLPIEELKRGIYHWFYSWSFPNRKLSPIVERACHALALDDERRTFHPLLWHEADEAERAQRHGFAADRITQVWFAGAHSNVGGGYAKDGLSYVALDWIIREAQKCGLRFRPAALAEISRSADRHAELYNSRAGLAGYYRYSPRNVEALCNDTYDEADKVVIERPKIHESVFGRVSGRVTCYAPTGLPAQYDIVDSDGRIVHRVAPDVPAPCHFESGSQAQARQQAQERVGDLIWWGRLAYLLIVAVSLYLLAFPFLHPPPPAGSCSAACLFDPLFAFARRLTPELTASWLLSFQGSVPVFLLAVVALAILLTSASVLRSRIANRQEELWRHLGARNPPIAPPPARPGIVFHLRKSKWLARGYQRLARSVIPFLFAVLLVFGVIYAINKLAVEAISAFGCLCSESRWVMPLPADLAEHPVSRVVKFDTRSLCQGTGITLEGGATYAVSIRITEEWKDWGLPAGADGLESRKHAWMLTPFAPLRRSWSEGWFRPIARVGSSGREEYALGSTPVRFTPTRDGELFLFVNEAIVFALPWKFYRNNEGLAKVTVTRLHAPL